MFSDGENKIATLDDLCRSMAPVFHSMGLPAPTATDVLDQLANEEKARLNTLQAQARQQETRRHERKFLRDERGNAYGHVKAEIPMELYMNLAQQRRFGKEALATPEGIDEVLKAYPACRVKQVGQKYIGRGADFGRRKRVTFGRGTLQLAT